MIARTAEKRFGALGRMGLVAAIHVAALFVIARSLGIVPGIPEVEPLIGTVIDEPEPVPLPPPPIVDPRLENPLVFVPRPDEPLVEQELPPPPIDGIGTTSDPPPVGQTGSAEPQPVIEAVRLDARHPLTQPPYPASLIRSGTEGSVDVEVFVQPNGRVGNARVVRSSGHELFDRATLDEARRNWRLLPATRNGEPYAQWYRLRVVFKLKNQQ